MWREIPNVTNLRFADAWGATGGLSLTCYDKGTFPLPWNASLSLRDILVPGAILRLTKRVYSNGTEVTNPDTVSPNDPLIREYFLLDPGSDDKTLIGGKASVFQLKATGPGEAVKRATVIVQDGSTATLTINTGGAAGYTATLQVYQNASLRGFLDNCVRYYLNDPVYGFNQRSGGAANAFLVKGTVDTLNTPTDSNIAVKARNEQLWDHLYDLASLGDNITKFPLQVWIDFQNTGASTARVWKPRVNLLRSNNTTFALPFAHSGFATTDPFAGPTESRILDEKTELTQLNVQADKERVLNKVKVRFAGAGTQAPQGESAYVTNAASITAYKTRETVTLDPWIQQDSDPGTGTAASSSTAATYRCNTLVSVYSGIDAFTSTAVGIVTATALSKTGELYSSSFNAVLGDTVGVRDRTGAVAARGKLLGYSYDQTLEQVSYTIGLPNPSVQAGVDEHRRRLKQRVANLSVTQTAPAAVTLASASPIVLAGSVSTVTAPNGQKKYFQFFAPGQLTTLETAEAIHTTVIVSSDTTVTGPVEVVISTVDSVESSATNFFQCTFQNLVNGSSYETAQAYPFAVQSAPAPNRFRIQVTNQDAATTIGTFTVTALILTRGSSPHTHNV